MKCLRFTLPSGSAGMAAGYTRGSIMKKLNNLNLKYKHKTQRYVFKVWFENDSDYTIFYLLWEAPNSWHKPELIEENYVPDESSSKGIQSGPEVKKE